MTYQETLIACGYPPDVLVMDVETYADSEYNLSKMTNYEYVTDSRFEVLGWAVRDGMKPAVFVDDFTDSSYWTTVHTIIHHNAYFDALVLKEHYNIQPPYIIDTLDLARHVEARRKNSLAALATEYGLQAKGDTKQFFGLHRADIVGTEVYADLCGYACNDADITLQLFLLLLPQLSNPKFELSLAAYTRNAFLNPVLCLNAEQAASLKMEMQAEVDKALQRADLTLTQSRSRDHFGMLLGEALGCDPPMKPGKAGRVLAVAKSDPEYKQLLTHESPRVRALMEARTAAKSWPLHIKRVGRLETVAACCDGRLPIPLNYYGAHTGRWSGTQDINLHNLPKRGHPLINKIRSLIEAPPDYTLVILDFAQIEARVLAWIAGQTDLIRKFAGGIPIYCEFASKLVRKHIRKPRSTDSKIVREWYGRYRQMGKIGILGCGYGMGAGKLETYADTTFGIKLTPREADAIVKLYRQENPMVVRAWKQIEKAFNLVAKGLSDRVSPLSGLILSRYDNTTVIELPSGRQLYYRGARATSDGRYENLVMPDPRSPTQKIHMWGGYLIENIVQAISRDILAEAILNVQGLGVKVPLTVHDDMAVVVPSESAEQYKQQIEGLVVLPPKWATGLPIAVDIKISKEFIT